MVYGKIHFLDSGRTVTATLTEAGWECPDAPMIEDSLNLFYKHLDTSPSLGFPIPRHINHMAAMLNGTAEITPLKPQPPGTVY